MPLSAPDFFDAQSRNWRARLAVSVEVMKELSRYTDPQELFAVFSRRMGQLFPTSRQITLSRRNLEAPRVRVTRFNLWKDQLDPWKQTNRLPVISGGLFADLIYADEPRVIDDLKLDPDDPAAEYLADQRSLLAIPHYDEGSALNLAILTREEPGAFPRERVPELVWMSNLFGRATQTLVLTDALREAYETVDFEMKSIADIQRSLLPAEIPVVPGLDVAVYYQTATRAGGDYYDFFPLPDGTLGVLIADVSGHGPPAAVLMAVTHSLAHARPDPPVSPGEFLTYLNAQLARRYTTPSGSFVTAFYGVIDPQQGSITYASAGHAPPRLVRGINQSRLALNRAQRIPLGINPGETYPEQTQVLLSGDQVVLFTDGLAEAVNPDGEMFGGEQLDRVLATAQPSAKALLEAVLEDLRGHTAGQQLTDDRTLLVIGRVPIQ